MLADFHLRSFVDSLCEELAMPFVSQRNNYAPVTGVLGPIPISARDPYLVHGLCSGCESCHGRRIPKRRQCCH